jgi:hypothetical protein
LSASGEDKRRHGRPCTWQRHSRGSVTEAGLSMNSRGQESASYLCMRRVMQNERSDFCRNLGVAHELLSSASSSSGKICKQQVAFSVCAMKERSLHAQLDIDMQEEGTACVREVSVYGERFCRKPPRQLPLSISSILMSSSWTLTCRARMASKRRAK